MEQELGTWKSKMYDMIRNIDNLKAADRERISSKVDELHGYVSEMEKIITQLQSECPADFSDQKDKLAETDSQMRKKYRDAMAAILRF